VTTIERTAQAQFEALGSTCVVAVTRRRRLAGAVAVLRKMTTAADRTYSRFRDDSELMRLAPGGATVVSPLLVRVLTASLEAARASGGLVDPTVGAAICALGYDRDFGEMQAAHVDSHGRRSDPAAVPGWRALEVDAQTRSVRVSGAVTIDLGAIGKALVCDDAAAAAARAAGCGVLVSIGGDVAVAGPAPAHGWPVGIADDHRAGADEVQQRVAIHAGAVATSSVTARRWTHGGQVVHHIVDPATGRPAEVVWRTVTVAAGSCAAANTATTAAIVAGRSAPGRLAAAGLPARLVSADGAVMVLGGWPAEESAA
jgi:FAD:protein FMN transferase